MLLEFETENYKSFKDRIKFSMIPAPKQKGLDSSLLSESINSKKYKALSSAVVYGPNAAGKTNIIGAMQTFKNIVLRGNIKNALIDKTPNAADYALELIPNNTLKEKKNVFFSIKFVHKGIVVKYSILLDLGLFLEKEATRSVIEEILEINEKVLFCRLGTNLKFENIKNFEDFLLPDFKKNFKTILSIAQNSLKQEDLFIANGFKTIVSSYISDFIINYLSNFFNTVYRADTLFMAPVFDTKTVMDEHLNEAAKAFGINSNKLIFIKSKKNENPPILCSVMPNKSIVPSEFFESYGTVRFVNMFPIIAETLKNGSTLIIDEFDSSIHPRAVINLISVFHDVKININKAQLIFNTHNPLYLNNNLFRRDEIKFVDRDNESKCSKHYSLSDFGTKGSNARKGKDYMNNYFMDEYGAIRDINFSDVLLKIIKED